MKHATLQEVCTLITSAWEQVLDHVIISGFKKAVIVLVEDTSKTDDESSDLDDDDVMLGSASRNSQSDKAILSLFLLDTEESDFFSFGPWKIVPSSNVDGTAF